MAPVMSVMLKGMDVEKMAEMKEEMMGRMFTMADLDHRIPKTQMKMQPGCVERLMGSIALEERVNYTGHLLEIMIRTGTEDLSESEKAAFRERIQSVVDEGFSGG